VTTIQAPVQIGWAYYDERGYLRVAKTRPSKHAPFPVYTEAGYLRPEHRNA
jgi:hypothetical protein